MPMASRMMAAPFVWAAAALLLWWGRLDGDWRRRIALASSAVGLIMLMLALNTEGRREAPTTTEFLLSGRYVTGHVSASASLPYYVITSVCLLLGTAGLVAPDAVARRLDAHWMANAVGLSFVMTVLRFALEKVAAPNHWVSAVGVTWLAPVVGAYFWMHLRERGRGVGALAARLLAYALLVRAGITALMIVATTQRLGSHYDLSGFIRVRVPVTGAVQTFEPGSWAQIAFLGAVPQLTFYVAYTVVMGLIGAGLYSVAGSINRPHPSPLMRPRFDWKPPPAPASQDR
ncbi:MAG TPA: hypothetical protein VIZ31_04140 [Vicinamibacteria bacterium]